MEKALEFEVATTEDGELWGVYTSGHIDIILIGEDAIVDAIKRDAEMMGLEFDVADYEAFKRLPVKHLNFRQRCHLDHKPDECDCPYYWCQSDGDGAVPVTGVKFL